jgi:tubulin-specific chaperone D
MLVGLLWCILTNQTMQLLQYQEQNYLLDPYLERMVLPVVTAFKTHTANFARNPQMKEARLRVYRLAQLLYNIIQNRGPKTVGKLCAH